MAISERTGGDDVEEHTLANTYARNDAETEDQTGPTVDNRFDRTATDNNKRKHVSQEESSAEEGSMHVGGDSEAVTTAAEHGEPMSIAGRTVGAAAEENMPGNSDTTHGEAMQGTGDSGTKRTRRKRGPRPGRGVRQHAKKKARQLMAPDGSNGGDGGT